MSAQSKRIDQQMLRSHEQPPIRALLGDFDDFFKIIEISRTVFYANDALQLSQLTNRLGLECCLGHHRHVVHIEGQGKLKHELLEESDQFRLTRRKIIRSGRHNRLRTRVGGGARYGQGFHQRSIGNTN
jgi:hypothetical protein